MTLWPLCPSYTHHPLPAATQAAILRKDELCCEELRQSLCECKQQIAGLFHVALHTSDRTDTLCLAAASSRHQHQLASCNKPDIQRHYVVSQICQSIDLTPLACCLACKQTGPAWLRYALHTCTLAFRCKAHRSSVQPVGPHETLALDGLLS